MIGWHCVHLPTCLPVCMCFGKVALEGSLERWRDGGGIKVVYFAYILIVHCGSVCEQ